MRFCLRSFLNGATRRRRVTSIFVCAVLALGVPTSAYAQFRKKGTKLPAAETPPAEEVVPPGMTMSKTQAVTALIQALTVNQSDAARQTLEQIVLGKMKFGAHNKQAAETALVALAVRPAPEASAFLLRLVSEPDDKVRPGDTDYPAAAVRYDAVRVAGKVGSPELRAGVAKFYDRASPEIRIAMETALGKSSPANFAAQVVLLRSRSIPDQFKINLSKLILDQNAAALKQALKIAGNAPAKDAAAAGALGEFGKLTGPGIPAFGKTPAGLPLGGKYPGPAAPVGPAAAAAAAQNPTAVVLDVLEKAIDAKPIDPAVVARALWQSEFVEALSAELSAEKTNPQQLLTGVGSIPLKTARERLRDYLTHKGPQELGQLARPAAVPGAAGGAAPGGSPGLGGMGVAGRGMGRGGAGGRAMGTAPAQGPTYAVGADWLDPGTVVVLKTLSYKDRPKSKHRGATPPSGGGKRTPAAEKRAEEAAEKQKQTEAQYEWRDAIEKFVSHWDERLNAVAEAHEAADADNDAAADTKEKAGAKEKTSGKDKKDVSQENSKTGSTSTKESDSGSKKTARGETKSSSAPKTKGTGSAPTPSVPLPFALRPGEHITKEFHLRWPDDLPSNLTAAVSEPLVVHYLQLEATDDINRTVTYYRGALSKGTGTRSQSATHDTADGKWVDILQRDLTGQRTRSFDVLVSRQPPDPDARKSKMEGLTIQVLMVEVESFEPEAKQVDKKEQAKSE